MAEQTPHARDYGWAPPVVRHVNWPAIFTAVGLALLLWRCAA